MNYRGHKKKKAKSKGALEKVPEGTALEKADGTIRRGRRAKHGQVEVLMEESPLEKGQKTKNQDGSGNKEPKAPKKEEPAAQSLEKDTKATKKEEPAAQSLEKEIKRKIKKKDISNPVQAHYAAAIFPGICSKFL